MASYSAEGDARPLTTQKNGRAKIPSPRPPSFLPARLGFALKKFLASGKK